jgi:hypothetical protein
MSSLTSEESFEVVGEGLLNVIMIIVGSSMDILNRFYIVPLFALGGLLMEKLGISIPMLEP